MREARLILEKSNFPIWFFCVCMFVVQQWFLIRLSIEHLQRIVQSRFFFSVYEIFMNYSFMKFSVVKLVEFCFMKCSCHHSFQNTSFLKKGGTNYRFFSFCLNRHINCFCWAAWLKIMHNVVSALSSVKELFLESPNVVNFTNQH